MASTVIDKAVTLENLKRFLGKLRDEFSSKADIEALGHIMSYRGSVESYDELPETASIGDVYNLADTGDNYAWDGEGWDKIGSNIDLGALAPAEHWHEKLGNANKGAIVEVHPIYRSVTEGVGTSAEASFAHAEGNDSSASGMGAHAEGGGTKASGNYSHAEGSGTQATANYAHSEGQGARAEGFASHAEGGGSNATNDFAHAEGTGTQAIGQASHAEGMGSKAEGSASHAEGSATVADAYGSHAEGQGTIAGSAAQHVQGRANVVDYANKYAHIVGGGTSSTRSNVHTLDWNGNAFFGKTDAEGEPAEFGTLNGVDITALPSMELSNAEILEVFNSVMGGN